MKYENREQIKNILLNSTLVVFNKELNLVAFTGPKLDRCELKINSELIEELITVCRILGIRRAII